MKLPNDGHAHFHSLISARLDGELAPGEGLELSEHMAECSTCRSIARDYRTQRALMGSLSAPPPPRDLWARTAAALDQEMAKGPHASDRAGSRHVAPAHTRRAPGSRWLGLTAATSVLLAGAVVATQLQSNVVPPTAPGTGIVRATPFDVTPQDMSVFDFTGHGVAVYQTRVTEACPPPQIDCTSVELPTNPVIQISNGSDSSTGLAVNSRSGHLALVTGGDEGAETVSIVSLPPYQNNDGSAAATPEPTGSGQGTGGPRPAGSGTPATNPPQSTDTPAPTATPKPTPIHTPSARPTATGSGPTQTPVIQPTTPRPPRSNRPTPVPNQPSPTVAPSGSSAPGTELPTPSPSDASPSPVDTDSTGTAAPDEAAMAIAVGVRLVGAAPEWNTEGDTLAFSAVPADLSTGPDVYLWRVGDDQAVRLTQDHRSYFASWAVDRIVISRLPADHAGDTAAGTRPVDALTVVVDLATGQQRVANGPSLWLPTVDPLGRYAVAWVGRLRTDGRQVTPRAGGLYFVDWTTVDPFDKGAGAGTPDATPTPAASTKAPRGASPSPVASRVPHHRRSSPSPDPASTPPATSTPAPTSTATPTVAATTAGSSTVVQAVDPQRDETADPVLDWVVRWSADGSTVGIWVADSPGANWGRLAVTQVSLQDDNFTRDEVLGSNLARRAFSMGTDRVAWIAPSDSSTDGDLRIRTWDARGVGDLRIHSVDAGDGVPSF